MSTPSFSAAVIAEGTVNINNGGDFDGNPIDTTDDAFIYAGSGLTFNFNNGPILPVQRNAAGIPLLDATGRQILVDNAVTVAAGFNTLNTPNNPYSGLVPPKVVNKQTVDVPSFATIKQQLTNLIPSSSTTISFNPYSNPINSLSDWNALFPGGGTATNPVVVRVSGWGLNIPDGVNIENTIIIVDNGDINFNGNSQKLKNVALIAANGSINLGNVQATDVTVLAERSINMNGGASFSGQSLLANGDSNGLNFNGTTSTTDKDLLTVISQGRINFNASSKVRAEFLSVGDFSYNANAELVGSIKTKSNVFFNSQATVTGIATTQPQPTGEIAGLVWNDFNANGVKDSALIQGASPDVVFVIDVSGSTSSSFGGTPVGDVNGDRAANTILDAEIAGFIALNQQLIKQGLGQTARVSLVRFDSTASVVDLNPGLSGLQLTTNPSADNNNNGTLDVEEALKSLRILGGTNFEAALQASESVFTNLGTPAGNGNLVFLSDGFNGGGTFTDEVTRLRARGVNLSAFGVGTGASLTQLQQIDPNAIRFNNTDQILNTFSGISGGKNTLEPGLAGVSVYLDLNNNGVFDPDEPNQITSTDNASTSNIDETGFYRFSGVSAGSYTVRQVVPSGFTQTFPNAGSGTNVTLTPGQVVEGINFGAHNPSITF
ncbi:von Willebrand factor type A domain-containing protein [Dulcicalothrix desertica PCC 7102]|nr:von Willebrand factor type A domain-containing protein [Dulcicalothrix desertica PCC 7102]